MVVADTVVARSLFAKPFVASSNLLKAIRGRAVDMSTTTNGMRAYVVLVVPDVVVVVQTVPTKTLVRVVPLARMFKQDGCETIDKTVSL